jgi:hypothetical protein
MEEVPETELEKGKGRDGQEEEGKGDQRKQGADKEESERMLGKCGNIRNMGKEIERLRRVTNLGITRERGEKGGE